MWLCSISKHDLLVDQGAGSGELSACFSPCMQGARRVCMLLSRWSLICCGLLDVRNGCAICPILTPQSRMPICDPQGGGIHPASHCQISLSSLLYFSPASPPNLFREKVPRAGRMPTPQAPLSSPLPSPSRQTLTHLGFL